MSHRIDRKGGDGATDQPALQAPDNCDASHLRMILDHVPALVIDATAELTVRYANPTGARWLGKRVEDVIGRSIVDLIGRDVYEQVEPRLLPLRSGKTVSYTRTADYHTGDRRQIRATFVPYQHADGSFAGAVALIEDISELTVAMRELETANELFRLVSETSADSIYTVDLGGVITFASPAAAAHLGFPLDRIVGSHFSSFFSPEQFPGVRAIFERVLAGEQVLGIAIASRGPDGKQRALEVNAGPLLRDGAIVGALGVARDVSARKQAECGLQRYQEALEALVDERSEELRRAYERFDVQLTVRSRLEDQLREREARFRELADSVPALMWVSDADGSCTFVSRGWLQFTGRSEADEYGDGWLELVHPDDRERLVATFRRALEMRRPFRLQYRLRRHDEAYRCILDDGVPRFEGDGTFTGFIGCCIDVTDLKRTARVSEPAPVGA